jgi:hypothetical protein
MDVLVRSQLNSVVQSYIGKLIMIVVPSQCVKQEADAEERTNHVSIHSQKICCLDANNQAVLGLPYSYTTGRNWNRHRIHGLIGDEAFNMEFICWSPDRLEDLQEVAAWHVQKHGIRQVLFVSLKGKAKIWNYENNRITGHIRLGLFQAEHIETYGQTLVDDSHSTDQVYVCQSIEDEYRQVRAPNCGRSNLEDFGQLSNHLGADHILFVPAINHQVEGRTMQQYLAFLDVPYDKVHHSFSLNDSGLYYVLYVRHCKLKLVLDVLHLLVDDWDRKPLLYVTPEGNLYELRRDMSILKSCGVFSRESYEAVFTESYKEILQIQLDTDFQYHRPNMFTRMGGAMLLGQLSD